MDMTNHKPFWPGHPAIILANGQYPTHEIPLEILNGHGYLCCCDRAGLTAMEHGLKPDAIVGDGDSLPLLSQKELAGIFHKVDEQEYNDLTKATRFMLAKGFREIVYLGATGLREDHTIANIALMATYRHEMGVEPIMATDFGWFSAHEGKHVFESFPGQQVSIFNHGCSRLRSGGLRWDAYPYATAWQGTLNEAAGEKFEIDADGTYIIYQTYDAK